MLPKSDLSEPRLRSVSAHAAIREAAAVTSPLLPRPGAPRVGAVAGARSGARAAGRGAPGPAQRRLVLAGAGGRASSARGLCLAAQRAGAPAGRAGGRQLQRSGPAHRLCFLFNAAALPCGCFPAFSENTWPSLHFRFPNKSGPSSSRAAWAASRAPGVAGAPRAAPVPARSCPRCGAAMMGPRLWGRGCAPAGSPPRCCSWSPASGDPVPSVQLHLVLLFLFVFLWTAPARRRCRRLVPVGGGGRGARLACRRRCRGAEHTRARGTPEVGDG